jgi:hypothetical protein
VRRRVEAGTGASLPAPTPAAPPAGGVGWGSSPVAAVSAGASPGVSGSSGLPGSAQERTAFSHSISVSSR